MFPVTTPVGERDGAAAAVGPVALHRQRVNALLAFPDPAVVTQLPSPSLLRFVDRPRLRALSPKGAWVFDEIIDMTKDCRRVSY